MAAPYSYQGGAQQQPARPAFDLDALLGSAPSGQPALPPGSPPHAPPPPVQAAAPVANDDPFGFNTAPVQQHQQQQHPPQQQQPHQHAAYAYQPPAQQPVPHQYPPMAQNAAGYQQQHAHPQQQPPYQQHPPYQQQQPPSTQQQPQQPSPSGSAYSYPGVSNSPPAANAVAYQQPIPTPDAGGMPGRQPSNQWAGYMQQPQQQQFTPQQQQQPYPSQQQPGGYAPPPGQFSTSSPQQQPPQQAAAYVSPSPPPSYGGPSSAPPAATTIAASPSMGYNEDQDRANLERIRRLREQLEREQNAESGLNASTNSAPSALGGGGTTASPLRASSSTGRDGWSCSSCTFRNKDTNATKCEICEEPRAGYTRSAASPAASAASGASSSRPVIQATAVASPAPSAASGGNWTCEMCQGQNSATNICRICNSPRPAAQQQQAPRIGPSTAEPPLPPNVWACKNCTLHNPSAITKCQACGYAKPSAGPLDRGYSGGGSIAAQSVAQPAQLPAVWACGTCTFENTIDAAKCTMCESARPSHITAQIEQAAAYRQQQEQRGASRSASDRNPIADLPVTINGRRLTEAEQIQLVRQQEQLLAQIQNGGAGNGGRRVNFAASGTTSSSSTAQRSSAANNNNANNDDEDEDSDNEGETVQWQRDQDAKRCNKCDAGFGFVVRRHHCRSCGFVFCKNCCNNYIKLKPTSATEVRVCNDCYREKTNPSRTPPPRAAPSASGGGGGRHPSDQYHHAPPPRSPPAQPQQPQRRAAVDCDCAGKAGGFHAPSCPNHPQQQQRVVDFF